MQSDGLLNFPPNWEITTIKTWSARKLIYGYGYNLENFSYSVYATDFFNVWMEHLSQPNIIEKASSYGIEDLCEEKLRVLLSTLAENFDSTTKKGELVFSVSSTDQSNIGTEIVIKSEAKINWEFSLGILSSKKAATFFSEYARQQHENHVYLRYHINNLDKVINEKDRYIDYLSVNYKAINGDELIKKYMNNNKYAKKYIEKYDEKYWNNKTKTTYQRNSRERSMFPKSPLDREWDSIIQVISDKQVWRSTSETMANNPSGLNNPKDAKLEAQSSFHKKKPIIRHEQSESIEGNSKPRGRLGIIGLRKRKST